MTYVLLAVAVAGLIAAIVDLLREGRRRQRHWGRS
jgi:hypothetical protein